MVVVVVVVVVVAVAVVVAAVVVHSRFGREVPEIYYGTSLGGAKLKALNPKAIKS